MVTTSISVKPLPSPARPHKVKRPVSSPPGGRVCSAVPRRPRIKWFLDTVASMWIWINDNDALGYSLIPHTNMRVAGRYETSPVRLLRKSICMIGYRECDTEKCIGLYFWQCECSILISSVSGPPSGRITDMFDVCFRPLTFLGSYCRTCCTLQTHFLSICQM